MRNQQPGTGPHRGQSPFALDHLTVIETTPARLFETARDAGYDRACCFVRSIEGLGAPEYRLSQQPDHLRQAKEALGATGVGVDVAYPFTLSRHATMADLTADLDVAAELGARFANILIYLRDEAAILDQTAAFCEEALRRGLGVAVEMVPASAIKTLPQASALVRAVDRPGQVGVNLDVLHLYRSGLSPDDVAPFRGDIVYAQLCDGPLARPADEWRTEASLQRDLPGRGAFDLGGFLAAVADVPTSIEVPDARGLEAGAGPAERARAALAAALSIRN